MTAKLPGAEQPDACEHDWQPEATMDYSPPIEGRSCFKCGVGEWRQDPPNSDGEWHRGPRIREPRA